jgi:hypothetical protein
MTQTSYNVLHRVVECSTCSQVFLVSPPDQSHTRPSLKKPVKDEDWIRARHVCSEGHGTFVHWANPSKA